MSTLAATSLAASPDVSWRLLAVAMMIAGWNGDNGPPYGRDLRQTCTVSPRHLRIARCRGVGPAAALIWGRFTNVGPAAMRRRPPRRRRRDGGPKGTPGPTTRFVLQPMCFKPARHRSNTIHSTQSTLVAPAIVPRFHTIARQTKQTLDLRTLHTRHHFAPHTRHPSLLQTPL